MDVIMIKERPNGRYRIQNGSFILKDNVSEEDLMETIESISGMLSGHPELQFEVIEEGRQR